MSNINELNKIYKKGDFDCMIPTGKIIGIKENDYQIYLWLQANSNWRSEELDEFGTGAEEYRYIYQNKAKVATIVQETGISKPTVSKGLKTLEKLDMIKTAIDKKGKKVYILPRVEDIFGNIDQRDSFYSPIKNAITNQDKIKELEKMKPIEQLEKTKEIMNLSANSDLRNRLLYVLIPNDMSLFMSRSLNKNVIKLYCLIKAYTELNYRNNKELGWYYKSLNDMALDIGLGNGRTPAEIVKTCLSTLEKLGFIRLEREEITLKDSNLKVNKYKAQTIYKESFDVIEESKLIKGDN